MSCLIFSFAMVLSSGIALNLSFVNVPVEFFYNHPNSIQVRSITTEIETAQNTSSIVDTLNRIPLLFLTNLLSENQIVLIYQNALLATIQIDVTQVFHVMNVILNQCIPKHSINNYILFSILDKAHMFMEESNIPFNFQSFHLMWEQILLHTLYRNYPVYITRSKRLFSKIQTVLFNETESMRIQLWWTKKLKSVHLELLILMYYNEPEILKTSFEKMLRLKILKVWSYKQITSKQMVLNLNQYRDIHILWIVKWAINMALEDDKVENIVIDANEYQKRFIINNVFKGLIEDIGGVFLVFSMADIVQLADKLNEFMKLDFNDLMAVSFRDRN